MNLSKVNRLEMIDHTACENCNGTGFIALSECIGCGGRGVPGRTIIFWDNNKQVDMELQDDDRTLKLFVHLKYGEEDATTV